MKKTKSVIKDESDNFTYLDLLSDNSPQAFSEYSDDADILNKEINNPSVYNIAVVAKYGAGKSSVINTYLRKYRNKKNENNENPEKNQYTKITLSTFNETNYDEPAIERSILQQLLYCRKKAKLPNSKIERTNKSSIIKSLLSGLVIISFIGASILFGIEITDNKLFCADWVKFLLFGISLVSLLIIICVSIHYQKLKKIKYKDLEADFSTDINIQSSTQATSLINKFIDEVLYFFECIDINLVIFEDLDRLPTSKIFIKLRELNAIINGSGICKDKITFLYAVKSELIKTEEERAKFFEFILPVIPIINPITSDEKLREKMSILKIKNEKMILHDKFIKGIAGYIPDMRILKNTFNDYIIMYRKIFEDKHANTKYMNNEKLFALCLYKNLYPYDYALLENDNGLIPMIIDLKRLRAISGEKIEEEIPKINEKIKELQSEKISSFEELKNMFIGQITRMSRNNTLATANTVDAINITTFDGLDFNNIKYPIPTVQNRSYSYNLIHFLVDLQGKKEILTPDGESYFDREHRINEKCNGGIEKANNELVRLKKERQDCISMTFSQLIKKHDINFCLYEDLSENYISKYLGGKSKNENIDNKKLNEQLQYLRFLIANDYIDEKYIEYTSNYKAQLISPNDSGLIMSIQRHEADYDCVPDDIEGVINRLDDDDFSNVAILNKSILESIETVKQISEKEKSKKYSNLINILKDGSKPIINETIIKFINTSEDRYSETLLKYLIPQRKSLFSELFTDNSLSHQKHSLLVYCIIKYSTDYKGQNKDNLLCNYISNYPKYLELFISINNEKKVFDFIDAISPNMEKLDNSGINNAIQLHIVKNNKYALNLHNLETIFEITGEVNINDNFYKSNYNFILTSSKLNVCEYVNKNIGIYADEVLSNEKISCLNEPQDKIEFLLKSKMIDMETKRIIIEKSEIKIVNISEYDEVLYPSLLSTESIIPSWQNILYVFEKCGFECVKDYLVQQKHIEGIFEITSDDEEVEEPTSIKFINEILHKADKETVGIIALKIPCEFSLNDLMIDDIEDEILLKFVIADKVLYCDNDLTLMYSKQKSLCEYLKIHKVSVKDKFDVFFNDIISASGQVTEANINYNAIIATIIDYTGIDISIKKLLIEKCSSIIKIKEYEKIYIKFIVSENIKIPTSILWQFTNATAVSDSDRGKILFQCIDNIDITTESSQLRAYLISLSISRNQIIDGDEKMIIKNTGNNEELLVSLKNKGWLKLRRSKDNFIIEMA